MEDHRGVTHLDDVSEALPNTGHYEGELDTQYLWKCNSDNAYQMSFNFEGVMDSQLSDIGKNHAKKMRMDIQKGGSKKLDGHQDLEP